MPRPKGWGKKQVAKEPETKISEKIKQVPVTKIVPVVLVLEKNENDKFSGKTMLSKILRANPNNIQSELRKQFLTKALDKLSPDLKSFLLSIQDDYNRLGKIAEDTRKMSAMDVEKYLNELK